MKHTVVRFGSGGTVLVFYVSRLLRYATWKAGIIYILAVLGLQAHPESPTGEVTD